jgi:Fe-S-cluster containining protein
LKLTKNTPVNDVLNLTHPCKCNACTVGCRHGSGFLVEKDIQKLAKFMNISEEVLKKEFLEEVEKFNTKKHRPRILRKGKPYGKCVFFDKDVGCKIHEAKPLECKIAMGCKDYGEQLSIWFMLNHFVNENDAESLRQYATYLKSGGKTLEGAELKDLVPDKNKLKKILEYEIR